MDTKTTLADEILTADNHLIQSFADLNALKQKEARTVMARAKGPYVYDIEDNEYLDGIAGLWCVNVGHGRHEIIQAITKQLETLDYYSTFYNFTHAPAAMLAKKLAELAPGSLNNVYFSNSGSVANDTAIRILHHYNNRLGRPNKKKILSRIGAYHGSTHLAMGMTTPAYSDDWDVVGNDLIHHLRCPNSYREAGEMNDAEFLDALADDMTSNIERIGAENIAVFIAEPIMGAGGVICAPDGYHKRMREITEQNDIKYISDEVVTAFGRLGHMFASEDVFGIVPDIITSAKGLTSGYQPLAATIISDEIYDVISEPGAMFLHGMTYSGHPAAAAAAMANINLMESEGIPARVQKTGKLFERLMRELIDLDIVGEVRGSHFMIGIELVRNKETKEEFADEDKVALKVTDIAQSKGLIARPLGNIIVMSPTLIMDETQIRSIARILRESIQEVASTYS